MKSFKKSTWMKLSFVGLLTLTSNASADVVANLPAETSAAAPAPAAPMAHDGVMVNGVLTSDAPHVAVGNETCATCAAAAAAQGAPVVPLNLSDDFVRAVTGRPQSVPVVHAPQAEDGKTRAQVAAEKNIFFNQRTQGHDGSLLRFPAASQNTWNDQTAYALPGALPVGADPRALTEPLQRDLAAAIAEIPLPKQVTFEANWFNTPEGKRELMKLKRHELKSREASDDSI